MVPHQIIEHTGSATPPMFRKLLKIIYNSGTENFQFYVVIVKHNYNHFLKFNHSRKLNNYFKNFTQSSKNYFIISYFHPRTKIKKFSKLARGQFPDTHPPPSRGVRDTKQYIDWGELVRGQLHGVFPGCTPRQPGFPAPHPDNP